MVLSRVELEIAPVVGNERLRKRKFLSLVNEYLLPVAWKHQVWRQEGHWLSTPAAFPFGWLAEDGGRTVMDGWSSVVCCLRNGAHDASSQSSLTCLHFALSAGDSLAKPV